VDPAPPWPTLAMTVLLVLALPCIGSGAPADAPGAEARRLTLPDCVRLAMQKADEDGILNNQRALADALRRETDAQTRPQLSVTVDSRYYTDSERDQDYGVSVSVGDHVLEIPQNMVRRRMVRKQLSIAEARGLRDNLRYAVQIRKAYAKCLETRDAAALASARRAAAEERSKALEGVPDDDQKLRRLAAAARLAADQQAVQCRDAEAAARAGHERLGLLCGLGTTPFTVEELPWYTFPPVELAECLRWAQSHRSDLAALQGEREVLTLAARLAGLERLPRPRFSVGYDSGDSSMDDTRGNFAMLALEVPLWDGGESRARKAQALARLDALSAGILQTESEITEAVTDSFIRLRQAAHDLERLRKDTEPEESFREKEVQHRHGALSATDYAAASMQWEQYLARMRATNRACHEAHANLMEALQASDEELVSGLRPTAAAGSAVTP
jgi:outer membrane protein TolC